MCVCVCVCVFACVFVFVFVCVCVCVLVYIAGCKSTINPEHRDAHTQTTLAPTRHCHEVLDGHNDVHGIRHPLHHLLPEILEGCQVVLCWVAGWVAGQSLSGIHYLRCELSHSLSDVLDKLDTFAVGRE